MEKTLIEKVEELTGKVREQIEEVDEKLIESGFSPEEIKDLSEADKKEAEDKEEAEDSEDAEKEDEKADESSCEDDKKEESEDSEEKDDDKMDEEESEDDEKKDDDEEDVEESYEHPWDELIESGIVTEGSKEEYTKFFNAKLKKYGVKSPSKLSKADKKKFFDEVEKEWTQD